MHCRLRWDKLVHSFGGLNLKIRKTLIFISILLTPLFCKGATQIYIPSTSTYHNYTINIESGTIRQLNTSTVLSTSTLKLTNGTLNAPSLAFSAQTTSGLFRETNGSNIFNNQIGLIAGSRGGVYVDTLGNVTISSGTLSLGANGTQNLSQIIMNSSATNKGTMNIEFIDNSGNTATNIRNMPQSGARIYTITDALANSTFTMTNGTYTDNSTTTYTGQNTFTNGMSVSTWTALPSIFNVGGTSVTSVNLPNYIQGADFNVSSVPVNCIGAYISTYSAFGGATGALTIAATDVWQNYLSMTLPAGIWTVSGNISFNLVTSTSVTVMQVAVSTYSANTTTDHITGFNVIQLTGNSGTFPSGKVTGPPPVVDYQVMLPVSTTIYLKGYASFTENSVNMRYGSMKAIRH